MKHRTKYDYCISGSVVIPISNSPTLRYKAKLPLGTVSQRELSENFKGCLQLISDDLDSGHLDEEFVVLKQVGEFADS